MSTAAVLACDGCGATAVQIGIGKGRALYPAGWLRLTVTGRPTDETSSVQLVKLDVCTPECAPVALKAAAERVAPPPEAAA